MWLRKYGRCDWHASLQCCIELDVSLKFHVVKGWWNIITLYYLYSRNITAKLLYEVNQDSWYSNDLIFLCAFTVCHECWLLVSFNTIPFLYTCYCPVLKNTKIETFWRWSVFPSVDNRRGSTPMQLLPICRVTRNIRLTHAI